MSFVLLNLWITICTKRSKFSSFVVKIFDEIAKTNKIIPKLQTIRKVPLKGKKKVKQPKFKYSVLQIFYNGFRYINFHIRVSEYIIIKKSLKVEDRFKIILLNLNNLKKFFGCLVDL